MRKEPFSLHKHSGKVTLIISKSVGNATVPVTAAPFPNKDTGYYQVDKHGDYVQEQN